MNSRWFNVVLFKRCATEGSWCYDMVVVQRLFLWHNIYVTRHHRSFLLSGLFEIVFYLGLERRSVL